MSMANFRTQLFPAWPYSIDKIRYYQSHQVAYTDKAPPLENWR